MISLSTLALLCCISASTEIISPWFDLSDVVSVQEGRYKIQSAEDGQYLSFSESKATMSLVTNSIGLTTTALLTTMSAINVVDSDGLLTSTMIGTACCLSSLFTCGVLLPITSAFWILMFHTKPIDLSEENETTWIIDQADGSFSLYFESPILVGYRVFFGQFVAVKANEDGDVYLKALWNGKRSKWLNGRHSNIQFRSRKQWRWKLKPDN